MCVSSIGWRGSKTKDRRWEATHACLCESTTTTTTSESTTNLFISFSSRCICYSWASASARLLEENGRGFICWLEEGFVLLLLLLRRFSFSSSSSCWFISILQRWFYTYWREKRLYYADSENESHPAGFIDLTKVYTHFLPFAIISPTSSFVSFRWKPLLLLKAPNMASTSSLQIAPITALLIAYDPGSRSRSSFLTS